MKANELRLGNLYDNNGNYFVVTPNTIESVFESERVWCKPINLTDEILFNCGFSKNVGHYIVFGRYKDKTLEVAYNNDTNETQYYVYVRGLLDNEFVQLRHDLKYLHELQNLYFAITGNELSVTKI